MAEQHLITAEFFGNPVSIIDHDGQQWLTAEQAGRCLGYSEDKARQCIVNAYNKHADEFTDDDTSQLKLMTPSGVQDCRIFSATGCSKLGFFARTARAKEFRTWASKVLSKKLAAPVAPAPVPAPSSRLDASLERMASSVETMAQQVGTMAEGMQTMSRQLNVTAKYIGLLETNQQGKRKITAEVVREAKTLAAEGMSMADIARLLRISRTSASMVVRDKYPIAIPEHEEEARPSTGELLEGWIEREQAKLAETLTKGGA
ncbi:BRO family protein [Candidatus Accumulibacter contiguus]|jgi:hypothetical protein|uniref:BRO family protein n=1 Tax=Candidatus Accumulibacter contiguus TaxID=2954381 RepID=UPI002FC32975